MRRDTIVVRVLMNGEQYAHIRPGFWGSQYLVAQGTGTDLKFGDTIYVRHPIHRRKVAMLVIQVLHNHSLSYESDLIGWTAEEKSRHDVVHRYENA